MNRATARRASALVANRRRESNSCSSVELSSPRRCQRGADSAHRLGDAEAAHARRPRRRCTRRPCRSGRSRRRRHHRSPSATPKGIVRLTCGNAESAERRLEPEHPLSAMRLPGSCCPTTTDAERTASTYALVHGSVSASCDRGERISPDRYVTAGASRTVILCGVLMTLVRFAWFTWRSDELPTGTVTFLFTDIEGSTRQSTNNQR